MNDTATPPTAVAVADPRARSATPFGDIFLPPLARGSLVPTPAHVADLRARAAVAVQESAPPAAAFPGAEASAAPEPVGDGLRPGTRALYASLDKGDWREIWMAAVLNPVAAGGVLLRVLHGISKDVCETVRNAVLRAPEPPRQEFGRVMEVLRGSDGAPTVRVELPPARREHGQQVRGTLVDAPWPEGARVPAVGEALRVSVEAKGSTVSALDFTPVPEGGVAAEEIASLVSAQYRNLQFCGDWSQEPIGDILDQQPSWPRELLRRAMVGSEDDHGAKERCALYRRRRDGAAVLVFEGTNPSSLADWNANALYTNGLVLHHQQDAPAIAAAVSARCPQGLLLAGHSKGGGTATLAGLVTGLPVVGFNAVGIGQPVLERVGSLVGQEELAWRCRHLVTQVMVRYDVASNVSGQLIPGGMGVAGPLASLRRLAQRHVCPPEACHILESPLSRWSIAKLHSMNTVCACLDRAATVVRAAFGHGALPQPSVYDVRSLDPLVRRQGLAFGDDAATATASAPASAAPARETAAPAPEQTEDETAAIRL